MGILEMLGAGEFGVEESAKDRAANFRLRAREKAKIGG